MERFACLLIGYIFGLFQTAYFLGKSKGIDIRNYGSGNSGTTNALRVLGTKAGIIVLLGDAFKCVFAVLIARFTFGMIHPELSYLYCMYAGAGAILGHNYPFYMNFKGGKGIAATAGIILSLHWYFLIMGVVVFFGIFFTTHYVSLGSLLIYVFLVVEMVVLGETGLLFSEMPRAQLIEMYIVTLLLAVLAFWKHRENIKRLIHGNERKTYLKKKNKLDVDDPTK